MEILYENLDKEAAYLFNRGENIMAYEFLGPHKREEGTYFALWAPNAKKVELVGEFNHWGQEPVPMKFHREQGIHQVTLKGTKIYQAYKYKIYTQDGQILYKADPFAFHHSGFPHFDSKIFYLEDLPKPKKFTPKTGPINIYEVNLASWKKHYSGEYYSYEELSKDLVDYVAKMGYTHIECMPIMEHPFDGSWGYQITGFYAPTSRFGDPKGFLHFVEEAHKKGIGIILDWVPSHYCKDDHGLRYFDGTALYESPNPDEAENSLWDTMTFDLNKTQVRSFLFSNAFYYRKIYGIDGIRVDAVAYMLYRGFGRWDINLEDPNNFREESIGFLKELNRRLKDQDESFITIAEESSNFSKVSFPVEEGGLGFDYKWNMGWMHDILEYMEADPIMRSSLHKALSFPLVYAFSENYILSISHDEVVHMKHSILNKMPGSKEDRLKQMRLFLVYMMAHPGKKLNFMGYELAQEREWNEYGELDWFLLEQEEHKAYQKFIQSLNTFYADHEAMWENDKNFEGFQWIDVNNSKESLLAFKRMSQKEEIFVFLNFTPVERPSYPFFVEEGDYEIVFSTYSRDKEVLKTSKAYGKDALLIDLWGFEGMYVKKINKKEFENGNG